MFKWQMGWLGYQRFTDYSDWLTFLNHGGVGNSLPRYIFMEDIRRKYREDYLRGIFLGGKDFEKIKHEEVYS